MRIGFWFYYVPSLSRNAFYSCLALKCTKVSVMLTSKSFAAEKIFRKLQLIEF